MLRCNMNTVLHLQLGLDDLLADLRYARRSGDLGRLALVAYCEVRRWARDAGDAAIAKHASELMTEAPHPDRETFLGQIDSLMGELEQARARTSDVAILLDPASGDSSARAAANV